MKKQNYLINNKLYASYFINSIISLSTKNHPESPCCLSFQCCLLKNLSLPNVAVVSLCASLVSSNVRVEMDFLRTLS